MFKTTTTYVIVLLILVVSPLYSQAPVISNISDRYGTVNQQILISGSGFSNNPAELSVFFGAAKGNIVSSTVTSIEVEVPSRTTTQSIQVVKHTNGLSVFSSPLFYISFGGTTFDPTKMGPEIQFTNANEYFDLCLCDFNLDGKSDMAVTQIEPGTSVIVYRNTSTVDNISFTKSNNTTNPELTINSASSNVTCGDIDGDGLTDLVVSKGGTPRNTVYVFRNISSGGNIRFANPRSLFLDTEDIAKRVAVRDIDLDGKPEIIVTNTFLPNIKIFRNNSTPGSISFVATPVNIDVPGAATTNGLVVDDLNGDRFPDIAVNPFIGNNVYFLVNRSSIGTINFDTPQLFTLAGNLNNLAAGDFNRDGKIDLVASKTIQDEIAVLVNNTTVNSSVITMQVQTVPGDNGPWGINTVDMDGDGRIDIIAGNRDFNHVSVFRNTGTGTTVSFNKFTLSTNLNTRNIKGGDIDGDGKPEMAFTSFNVGTSQYSLSIKRNLHCFVPRVEPAGPLTICTGETKRLTANKTIGGTYQWDKDNVVIKTGAEDFLDITSPGVYKVVVTTEAGSCVSASNAVIVQAGTGSVPADPVIYNTGPFCEGSEIRLSTDDVNNAIYTWEGPNGYTTSTRDLSIPNATSSWAGSYSLVVKVQDCSSNPASTLVDVTTLPDFSITSPGSTDACEGGSVQLSVNNIAGYSYQWYQDTQPISGANTNQLNTNVEGLYQVRVTQTSSSCSKLSNNAVNVNIFSLPVAIFDSPDQGCFNNEIFFENLSTWDPAGIPVFSWNFGDGSPPAIARDTSHIYTAAGNYNVRLTVNYSTANCPNQISKNISILGALSFEIVRSILDLEKLCVGQEVSLATIPEFERYLWSTGETASTIDITTTGDYSVTVTDDNNCTGTQTEFVEFLPTPEVAATSEVEEATPGVEFQLEAQGALNYFWTPVEVLDDPTSSTPNAIIQEATEFVVKGEDANLCVGYDTVFVSVKGKNKIYVTPHKVFSPNGDGIDDFWLIEDIERYPDSSITIFTAEGSTVYEASPYFNDWNAVYNGRNLPEGAYFYVIRAKNKDPKTGSVTVIR